tara:strand:- start:186 stop:350 length:165 start_codon:yes stop_codon:yes gene_type:complete
LRLNKRMTKDKEKKSFFPKSVVGWLLLILIIGFFVVVGVIVIFSPDMLNVINIF